MHQTFQLNKMQCACKFLQCYMKQKIICLVDVSFKIQKITFQFQGVRQANTNEI